MENKLRRIAPGDLSMLKNIPAASSAISSGSEAMKATSEPGAPLCSTCKGAGFFVRAVPYGHPHFGQLIACHCKDEEKKHLRTQQLLQMSNLDAFLDKTFADFDAGVPGVQRAYARARAFAEHPNKWLVLMGNYGCGKTHLAAAIANELLSIPYEVLFTVVPDLLDHLRSTFGPNSEIAYDARFEQVRNAKVLVLDDLGTENATPWAREKLFQIFNHRYNYRLPTVITSNRDPKDIDPRIFSRMSDRDLCDEITMINADDYRRVSSNQRFGPRKQRFEQQQRANRRPLNER